MFSKTTKAEPLKIITLAEAKDQLNIIDFDDDDDLIDSYIMSASDICERTTNTLFSNTTVRCRFVGLKAYLPYTPYINASTVQVNDVGVDYEVDEFSNIISITDTSVLPTDTVTVIYQAGHTAETIPLIVKQACKIMVTDFYDQRGSTTDGKSKDVPLSALTLLNTLRVNSI